MVLLKSEILRTLTWIFLMASSNQIVNLRPFQEASVHIFKTTNPAGTDCSREVKVEWT